MPTLNPNTAFQLPPKRKVSSVPAKELPNDWLDQLIQVAQKHIGSNSAVNLAAHVNGHIGALSIYPMKRQIIDALKAIYLVMMDEAINNDTKVSISLKLAERAENCTPGFHDGVNAIVDGFEQPDSMDALLYRVRHDIVSKTANQSTDEVHGNNRFFTIAQTAGFGVRALNPNDIHTGNVSDETIKANLDKAFSKDYQLLSIFRSLKTQIDSELIRLGYHDGQAEYDSDSLVKCEKWLTTLFNDTPAVQQQLKALREVDSLQSTYDRRVHDYMMAGRKEVLDLLDVETQPSFIDNIIRSKIPSTPPALVKRYQVLIDNINRLDQNVITKLQQNYEALRENMSPIMAQINEAKRQSSSLFLNGEHEHKPLNWNKINQAIWEELRRKSYFILTKKEILAFDSLFNDSEPFGAKQCHDLMLTGSDVMALLEMNALSHEKMNGLLDWYIRESTDIASIKLTHLFTIQRLFNHNTMVSSTMNLVSDKIDALIDLERTIWLNKLTNPSFNYSSIPQYLRQDRSFMLAAVKQRGFAIDYAADALKADKAFMLAAVEQNGSALDYAADDLKADKAFVLTAVKQNGSALDYASDDLKADKEVVLAAVQQQGLALYYAADTLKADKA